MRTFPLVVHYKLIGFIDIELQVIVVAPRDKAQFSVFFCKGSMSLSGKYSLKSYMLM